MKALKRNTLHGAAKKISIDEAVADVLRESWHGMGQVEAIQAELSNTKAMLGRLVEVLSESLTKEQIQKIISPSPLYLEIVDNA